MFKVPWKKVFGLQALSHEVLATRFVSVKNVAYLAGKMMAVGHCIQLAPLFSRAAIRLVKGPIVLSR